MEAGASDPNDPIQKDAKTIADNAADLSKARTQELADKEKGASLSQTIERLDAERAAAVAAKSAAEADEAVQRARESGDEQRIADAVLDAQQRTAAAPGPTPPPQPPRPRVG